MYTHTHTHTYFFIPWKPGWPGKVAWSRHAIGAQHGPHLGDGPRRYLLGAAHRGPEPKHRPSEWGWVGG